MSTKPRRRQRYEGMSVEQTAQQLSDDLDLMDAIMEEHLEDDEAAHRAMAEAWQEWTLNSLRSQNRIQLLVIMALIAAFVSAIGWVIGRG